MVNIFINFLVLSHCGYIFYNVKCGVSKVLAQTKSEGHNFSPEDLAVLSPYWREHTNRFGDYTLNLDHVPAPMSNTDLSI